MGRKFESPRVGGEGKCFWDDAAGIFDVVEGIGRIAADARDCFDAAGGDVGKVELYAHWSVGMAIDGRDRDAFLV